MKTAVILASLLTATAIAHAGDPVPDAARTFNQFIVTTGNIASTPLGRNLDTTPADACFDAFEKAKSDGVPANTELDFTFRGVGKILFSEVPTRVCVPYERAVHAATAAQMLATTNDGKQCASEMDWLLKFGIADIEIEVRDVAFKLGDAKKKICEPIAKGLPISEEDKARAREAAAVPYKEAGIDGGKLNVCIANGANLRGAGGATLTPAKIKRASLLFVVTGPVDKVYTLQRLTFKGDEIATASEKTFKKAPVAADYH